jgi:anhydro-N-acetylmuramic acid kinase
LAPLAAIGLMSGTSYDGIDLALIETDGESIGRFGPTGYRPYSHQEREQIRGAIAAAVNLTDRSQRPKLLLEVEQAVTATHAEAVEAFLAANELTAGEIDVVGFHGQTILHRPDRGLSVQLGSGSALAARLGIAVVYDFRGGDIAAGGQGAPLVPVFHRALARTLGRPHPIAILNVGGVANVTFIDADDLCAFDTGPGNALIDDFVGLRIGQPRDDEGRCAAAGRVDQAALERVLTHPFFSRPPPKSLDRNAFRAWVSEQAQIAQMSTNDGAATLTAITAAAVAQSIEVLPHSPLSWIVAGGGTRNPVLMRMLTERLAPAPVETAADVGWSADALEAQAFGYLAVRTVKGLPLTFPTTTGVPHPLAGGVLVRP